MWRVERQDGGMVECGEWRGRMGEWLSEESGEAGLGSGGVRRVERQDGGVAD